jgi:hypothetical protein
MVESQIDESLMVFAGAGVRVTRLAKFSPIGWLLVQILGYFVQRCKFCISYEKDVLGYFLGDIFTNLSSHIGGASVFLLTFFKKVARAGEWTRDLLILFFIF